MYINTLYYSIVGTLVLLKDISSKEIVNKVTIKSEYFIEGVL